MGNVKGSHRYQSDNTNNPIHNLKNRLADNNLSVFQFYMRYYRKHCHQQNIKTYRDFLLDLNWFEVWTGDIKLAANKFKMDSK
jgi:hypothetical protein